MVPTFPFTSNNANTSGSSGPKSMPADLSSNQDHEVKVSRSISDVVKGKQQQQQAQPQHQEEPKKTLSGRKTKEERRISNRQKLLSLKRHSGFLKRPEILETVYSVEEDGEGAQAQQQQQQQEQQKQEEPSKSDNDTTAPNSAPPTSKESFENQLLQRQFSSLTDSPPPGSGSRRGSAVQLTGFRYRLDSDMTCSDNDYSTDDDSTRIFYSETTTDFSTSCSQPCSRRSSYGTPGGVCSLPCSRRSSYGQAGACSCPQCWAAGSLTGSRRSSYGSHINLSTTDMEPGAAQESQHQVQSAYNRVMLNHRAVTKPKDVKFKRINKAKSRSLEELRGKLKWSQSNSANSSAETAPGTGAASSNNSSSPSSAGVPHSPMSNVKACFSPSSALKRRRGLLQHCASLDRHTSDA